MRTVQGRNGQGNPSGVVEPFRKHVRLWVAIRRRWMRRTLYSYAREGEHRVDEGLLLRKRSA